MASQKARSRRHFDRWARTYEQDSTSRWLAEIQGEALPFADESFTSVLCTTSFHHYPSPRHALGEMARVLAPRGRLVLGDPNPERLEARLADRALKLFQPSHVGFYCDGELRTMLTQAGLQRTGVRYVLSGRYALTRAEKPG